MTDRLRACLARLDAMPPWIRWLAAFGWAATLWMLSARPGTGATKTPLQSVLWNGGHVAAYFVLALLVALALRESVGSVRLRPILAACAAALYGVVDEWHQSAVPGRVASVWDVISDTVGGALAAALMLWLGGVVGPLGLVILAPLGVLSAILATFGSA